MCGVLERGSAWPGTEVKPTAEKCPEGKGQADCPCGVSRGVSAEDLQKLGGGLLEVKTCP